MKIAVIDSTIREESRTRKILNNVLKSFDESLFKVYNINDYDLEVTNSHNFDKKNSEEQFFKIAKEIASYDGLVIAAPFWDMTYPAELKVFIEKLSIFEVMFIDDGKTCIGISKNKFMLFLTTRGMNIETYSELDGASFSLKALCKLWGIPRFECVGAHNMDYLSEDEVNKKINETSKKAIATLKQLMGE